MTMKPKVIPIKNLLLDEENPRLPEDMQTRTQAALATHIANEYNTLDVARSIAEHGYFDSEPLIAIKARTGAKFVVVEGNRRLTVLKILSDPAFRATLSLDDGDDWDAIAADIALDRTVPVHVAQSRREVAPIIGYRHIAGIEPWDPWAKARFIAKQIEEEDLSFGETARIVGEGEADVRSSYRNFRIVMDAKDKLTVDSDEGRKKFGFFTRAMNSVGLRKHIGAPAPNVVAKGKAVLKPAKKKEAAELFSWLFGDATDAAVISDSRQLSDLGTVVGSPEALAVLRDTRNLDDALLASGGTRNRLLRRLAAGIAALEKAELDIGLFRDDPEVQQALDRCAEALARLRDSHEA